MRRLYAAGRALGGPAGGLAGAGGRRRRQRATAAAGPHRVLRDRARAHGRAAAGWARRASCARGVGPGAGSARGAGRGAGSGAAAARGVPALGPATGEAARRDPPTSWSIRPRGWRWRVLDLLDPAGELAQLLLQAREPDLECRGPQAGIGLGELDLAEASSWPAAPRARCAAPAARRAPAPGSAASSSASAAPALAQHRWTDGCAARSVSGSC